MVGVFGLAACNSDRLQEDFRRTQEIATFGVSPEIDAASVRAWSDAQTKYLAAFAGKAEGELPPLDGDKSWPQTTLNGLSYVDTRCAAYFKALDDYADYQNSLRNATGLVGTATTGIMSALNAASQAVTAVAGAFTLGQGLMDASSAAVLFPIEPTKVQNLHGKAASAYRYGRADQIKNADSRAAAGELIGSYIQLCTPVTLKGMIGETISQVELGSTPDGRIGVTRAERSALLGPIDVKQPIPRLPRPPQTGGLAGASNDVERLVSNDELLAYQGQMCVRPTAPSFGPKTREAIATVRERLDKENFERLSQRDRGLLSLRVVGLLASEPRLQGSCPTELVDVFERIELANDTARNDLFDALEKARSTWNLEGTLAQRSLTDNRRLISQVATKCNLTTGERVTAQILEIAAAFRDGTALPQGCPQT